MIRFTDGGVDVPVNEIVALVVASEAIPVPVTVLPVCEGVSTK